EPVRKKQGGRGARCRVSSRRLRPRVPHSHRLEGIPPYFCSHPDQRPSAAASDLVSFGGSECNAMDDSISLVASDVEELATSPGMDAELFRILSKEEPTHGRLDEWFLPYRRQAPRQRASPFFPKPLIGMDESGPDLAAFKDLRSATDLTLCTTKMTAQAIG
ncbi:hypothetical protein M9458_005171, partial [Cirrhinus mrigala]